MKTVGMLAKFERNANSIANDVSRLKRWISGTEDVELKPATALKIWHSLSQAEIELSECYFALRQAYDEAKESEQ